jgi:hypothetical protein
LSSPEGGAGAAAAFGDGATGGGLDAGDGALGNNCANVGGNGRVRITYTVHPPDACHNPDAPEGETIYNADYHVLQYCDGQDWRAIGK